MVALKALRRAEDPLTPPTPSLVCSVNELMEGTLKDYEEECVEEGTFHSDPATEVGEWEVLDEMDTQFNQLLYESCPFHPHRFLECVNPRANFGPLRFKCSQEGCPVYLFEDTREVMMDKLKEDTHPQVRARVQRGELKCRCGFVPKMKLSRTAKNYNKVFFSCGSFLTHAKPCGYFQWLHGPLWCLKHPGIVPKPVPLMKGKSPEYGDSKASVIERWHRTLKQRMYRYFTAHNTLRYVDVLQPMIHTYNHAYHRSIGLAPHQVTPHTVPEVWDRLYGSRLHPKIPRPNVEWAIGCVSTRNIVPSKKGICRAGRKKCLWSRTCVVIPWSPIDSVNGTAHL